MFRSTPMRRASRIVFAAAVLATALGAGGRARGEEPAAKAVFLDGERSFQLGKFEDAIAAYERAFSLDPQPAFVFNIALAHRRQYEIDGKLDHLLRARELYRNYLRLEPGSPRRAGVEKLIVELSARIDAARTGPTNPPAAPPSLAPPPLPEKQPSSSSRLSSALSRSSGPPASAPPASRTTLYLVGGAAVVAAVALTILLASAHARNPGFDGPGVDLTPR
jgi:tetratricopeptide (TPR) repeat protein